MRDSRAISRTLYRELGSFEGVCGASGVDIRLVWSVESNLVSCELPPMLFGELKRGHAYF